MRASWIIVGAICGVLCLGGCGQSGDVTVAGPPAGSSGPDYSKDGSANQKAAEVASQFVPAMEKDASYGGLTIVSSGLRVGVVGTPSTAVAQALSGMRKKVPVATWPVRHSLRELKTLTARIDGDTWRDQGINLSSWGPDEATNVVVITLTKYRPEAAKQLADAYGSTWIRVSKRSETNVAADGAGAAVG